jgi:DNA topoisomerase-1
MSNKYITTNCLVIVESPAKCAKIEGYLGPGYKVAASYGHLRELKKVDVEHGFKPIFTIIDNSLKKKQIALLRQEINKADDIILASDDDREGEAIAWHICDLFKLDVEKTKRITFNEITESALNYAIHNPRTINMNLVYAQQARQILDLLVGFKVSPMLWKFITNHAENSLSAGRCQTPALKIIYDNQQLINNIQDATIYNTTGYFTNSNLCFKLNKQFDTKEQITDFLDGSSRFEHIYTCTSPTKSYKKQPEPFTTSTIQQTASNEFRYSPKETMKLCQKLYEAGYITYMRTDSKTYSADFIEMVKDYIEHKYSPSEQYVHPDIDLLVSGSNKPDKSIKKDKKNMITQDAHEAIRPTNISLYNLPETIDLKEKKMYNLIWQNTLESCMAPAIFNSITATILGYTNTQYTYSSELIYFPGWKIVAQKYSTENKEYHYLQSIKPNAVIPYKKIISQVAVKNAKHHYTEARLVQLLEEHGIGRPSTFSMLVDKIQERGYVKKEDVKGKEIECCDYELADGEIFESEVKREFGNEKGKLIIQPMGIIVMEFLEKHFLDIFNYDFTKTMEDDLDNISKGIKSPIDLIMQCNTQLDVLIDQLKTETKIEVHIDDQHTYLVGKYGPVIKCIEMDEDGKEAVSFKSIRKDVDIHQLGQENGEYNLDDIIDTSEKQQTQYSLGTHEGEDVILKKGRFGLYITWGTNSKSLKEFKNRQMENITFDDVKPYLESSVNNNIVREITPELTIKKGPKGDYIFYKKPRSKKPTFFDIKAFYTDTNQDYKTCDILALKAWIKVTYKV